MKLTWHGHATWFVEVDETSILIDPFFDNPKTDQRPRDIESPDFVALTHGHADHIAHVGAFEESTVVATPELAAYVEDEYGVNETVGMNLGGTYEAGDAFITMHRADHTNGLDTDYAVSGGMPAGLLISDAKPTKLSDVDTETFYHTGDTALMTEMREVIGPYLEPDAAAVPIGDHFTMGPEQAAIAVDWLDVDVAFPIHYDTFPPIEQDPEDFRREVKGTGSQAEVVILDGDESYNLTERDRF
ncbi:MAG: metal-dependent hydrolase [Halobacteriaceae archaeon]